MNGKLKKIEDEQGEFQDKDNNRYLVIGCSRVIAPDGKKNAELGYTEFETIEDCLKAWELTEVKEEEEVVISLIPL